MLKYAGDTCIEILGYSTERYYLQLGQSVGEMYKEVPVYQIVNKKYGIIEGESISLVDALFTLGNRTHLVKEYEEAIENGFPMIDSPPTGDVH